jgi:hypothetical protein
MTWERALEADARLAAKNAVLIRAALRQSFDPERALAGYKNTQPDESLSLAQQRVRARSWAIMNIRPNLEPLRQILYKLWSEGYALGDLAARMAISEAERAQKADTSTMVDWNKWKPGDAASAILLKPPKAFQRLLEGAGITLKGFSDTTLTDIGNAIGEAIELGLDAKVSAKNILNHVANPARALSIAITEQNRAISTATANRYLDAGLSQMEWLVFQPCKICAENEGKKVSIGAPFPSGHTQPPAHPHCRCALAPVIPGMDDPSNTAGLVTQPLTDLEGNVTQEPPGNYRGFHRAPTRADEFGAPATNVEEMMPDFYARPNIYTTGMPQADKESLDVLRRIKDKPEELVTIYRAVPTGVNQINPGDWVTLSPSYAETHLAGNVQGGGRVISMQIRAKDLWFDGDSINEFGYDPVDRSMSVGMISIDPKIMPKNPGLDLWNKNELMEVAAIKDPQWEPRKIWDGASQQYIEVVRPPGDPRLKKLLELQGFSAKPKIVDAPTMDELGKKGEKMYRGLAPTEKLTVKNMIEQFKNGDLYVGTGVIGNGVYASNQYDYVLKYAENKADNVMNMVFLPDAKFVDAEVAKGEAKEMMNAFFHKAFDRKEDLAKSKYAAFVESFGDLTQQEAKDLGWFFRDAGSWAAANGYDAIQYAEDGEKVFVILNRGAVAIQK